MLHHLVRLFVCLFWTLNRLWAVWLLTPRQSLHHIYNIMNLFSSPRLFAPKVTLGTWVWPIPRMNVIHFWPWGSVTNNVIGTTSYTTSCFRFPKLHLTSEVLSKLLVPMLSLVCVSVFCILIWLTCQKTSLGSGEVAVMTSPWRISDKRHVSWQPAWIKGKIF